MELSCSRAFWHLDSFDWLGLEAGEGLRAGALLVGIVIQQGVLRGDAVFFFVELPRFVGCEEEGFEHGDLLVLIQVCLDVAGDGACEVMPEAGEVNLIRSFGGGDDGASGLTERLDEGT